MPSPLGPLPTLIFSSRWLQLPLYLGLIVAQGVYVVPVHQGAVAPDARRPSLGEQDIMLIVLGLIDVVMISNLLMMVIIGGYETFVSRLAPGPSRPARVAEPRERQRAQGEAGDGDHRHLVDPPAQDLHRGRPITAAGVMWQTIIHTIFILSAIGIAWTDRLMMNAPKPAKGGGH
jgi:uncharacterized membrane protein YqhA